jgi:hypothetical protein
MSHLRLPQPGGPGSYIYFPQEQGGPVIPPDTGSPFHHLLRLAGLKLKLIYNWQSVGKSVLVSGSNLEPMTRILYSVWRLWDFGCGAPSLMRGWVCNLLVQLLLDLARAFESESCRTHDHITQSHLRLPQPSGSGPHVYSLQEQGGLVIPPSTGFPSCCLLRLTGLRWRYSKSHLMFLDSRSFLIHSSVPEGISSV